MEAKRFDNIIERIFQNTISDKLDAQRQAVIELIDYYADAKTNIINSLTKTALENIRRIHADQHH